MEAVNQFQHAFLIKFLIAQAALALIFKDGANQLPLGSMTLATVVSLAHQLDLAQTMVNV